MKKRNNQETEIAFDPILELAKLRQRHKAGGFRTSKLFPYLAYLVQLRRAGASYQELQEWLEIEKNVKVEASTVFRFLKSAEKHQASDDY